MYLIINYLFIRYFNDYLNDAYNVLVYIFGVSSIDWAVLFTPKHKLQTNICMAYTMLCNK